MSNVVDHPHRHTVYTPEMEKPRAELFEAITRAVADFERDNVMLPASGYALLGAVCEYMMAARGVAKRLRSANA